MVEPLYRSYVKTNQKDIAIKFFEEYKMWYHPIARAKI